MFKRIPSFFLLLWLVPSAVFGRSYTVERVVDGDTLKLSNGQKIRLIGVDTPETFKSQKLLKDAARERKDAKVIQALGKQSTQFVKSLVLGKKVELRYDQSTRVKNHQDRYGRTLAYVYIVGERGPPPPSLDSNVGRSAVYKEGFLNAIIVYAGYGNAYTRYPHQYMDDFRSYERQAREAQRGLWKPEKPLTLTQSEDPDARD